MGQNTFRVIYDYKIVKPKPKRKNRPRIVKCETCGKEHRGNAPIGWLGGGYSKYGKQYNSVGLAHYCPMCRKPDPQPPA